jgi:hypothetical protein
MATKTRAVTVSTTATDLLSASDDDRAGRSVAVYNASDATVYIGGADVTTANGIPIATLTWGPGLDLSPGNALYGIVAASTKSVRVLEVGV